MPDHVRHDEAARWERALALPPRRRDPGRRLTHGLPIVPRPSRLFRSRLRAHKKAAAPALAPPVTPDLIRVRRRKGKGGCRIKSGMTLRRDGSAPSRFRRAGAALPAATSRTVSRLSPRPSRLCRSRLRAHKQRRRHSPLPVTPDLIRGPPSWPRRRRKKGGCRIKSGMTRRRGGSAPSPASGAPPPRSRRPSHAQPPDCLTQRRKDTKETRRTGRASVSCAGPFAPSRLCVN